MSNTAYSFARTELKYLLSRTQYEAFCAGAAPYFAADAYGKTTICNLYYDTEDFELIRRSVEKPPYKEKLRLRSYGVPQENDTVFLEIKKKYNGTVYKRRISLALQNADAVLQGEAPSGGQIGREIQWFLHMHALAPRVFLAYERTAFFGKQDPSLRLTFDEALRYRTDCLSLRQGDRGMPVLPGSDAVLLELKLPQSCPLWLSKLLCDCCIFPASFSKYGTVYQRYLLPQLSRAAVLPTAVPLQNSNLQGGDSKCLHPSYPQS